MSSKPDSMAINYAEIAIPSGGHFEGDAWERRSRCCKAAGTQGDGGPIVNVFKNALWTALKTISRTKIYQIAGFWTYKYNLNFFSVGDIYPRPLQKRPKFFFRGWYIPQTPAEATQIPISAWLASVPTVPVLRNDLCASGHRGLFIGRYVTL